MTTTDRTTTFQHHSTKITNSLTPMHHDPEESDAASGGKVVAPC